MRGQETSSASRMPLGLAGRWQTRQRREVLSGARWDRMIAAEMRHVAVHVFAMDYPA